MVKHCIIRMRDQQDRLFGMVHESIRQTDVIFHQVHDRVFAWNILCGDDDELIPIHAFAKLNRRDASPRNGASNRCAMQHAWQADVINVLRAAKHLRLTLFARHVSAYG